jgi:hypothetical protein
MEARSKHTYASKKVAMRLVFSIDERTELGTTGTPHRRHHVCAKKLDNGDAP